MYAGTMSAVGRVLLYAVKGIDLPHIPRKQLLVKCKFQPGDLLETARRRRSKIKFIRPLILETEIGVAIKLTLWLFLIAV